MITELDTSTIVPGNNDRTQFPQVELEELAASIQAHGLIQPITVRALDADDLYQIVAGERRYRAVRLLGWVTIPAIVKDLSDEEAAAIMLAENVARQDLDPIDEALAYANRMHAYGWSVQDCADKAGVSTVRVNFRLKLLRLRPDIQALVRSGNLALGYAQILSDGDLDANFQSLALRRLRDNPNPTPPWFRRQVSELKEQQAQASLFDTALFISNMPDCSQAAPEEPPHPSTTCPPVEGNTPRDRIANQITFWRQAAEAWDRLGKPFKRQECEAAVTVLAFTLSLI